MANFTVNVAGALDEVEISRIADDFFSMQQGEAQVEHNMLVDATQILALGGLSLREVWAPAVATARTEADYSVGRMFDLYTKETLNYGKHVASVTSRIDSDTNISKAMTFSGLYKKTRQQILINSELKTDSSGRQYFEVLKRSYNVTTNATGPWAGYGKRNGAMRRHKLFVRDLSRGIFLLNGEAVSLGSTSVYDQVINDIYATGVVARYEQLLNGFSQDKVETLSDNQELLFLNVFQVLKPELVEEA